MEPFATLTELQLRCDWTFDADETRSAPSYLEEASDLVRSYGRPGWTPTTAPRMVKNIVISAVRRYMRNPEGYTQSRAGDETLAWSDMGRDSATIFLTAGEIRLIRGMAGGGGIRSVQVTAWGPHERLAARRRASNVPVAGWPTEKPFPYYADPVEPW